MGGNAFKGKVFETQQQISSFQGLMKFYNDVVEAQLAYVSECDKIGAEISLEGFISWIIVEK